MPENSFPSGASPSGVTDLAQLLYRAARSHAGITIYSEWEETSYKHITYKELVDAALNKASVIKSIPNIRHGKVILLHFSSFEENVLWFWAVVLAGFVPAISTPVPADPERRRIHLAHIRESLQQPIVLTSKHLKGEFENVQYNDLHAVDHPKAFQGDGNGETVPDSVSTMDPTVLMLTSGSSGNAKAVVLSHKQIITSVSAKSAFFDTTDTDIFLNWIGFDHVACLVETHIHAIYVGSEFVHVPAPILMADPRLFLRLIGSHRVTYTFAPHFFLSRLLRTLTTTTADQDGLDISCLRHLVSGGESNTIDTVVALTMALQGYNLQSEVIRPGFGMTETCAGSIYSKACPAYDVATGNPFASLGKPIPGIRMRIMDAMGHEATTGNIGDLQVKGPLVFREYYNNPKATTAAFTDDGWFITGDRASLDGEATLNIAGREQESINLNGVKYFPNEIETALDEATIAGLTLSYTIVFSIRPSPLLEEEICVIYHPTYDPKDTATRVETARQIVAVVGTHTTCKPKHIVPLPKVFLHKSALGKLSRTKIRAAFEGGVYDEYEDSKDIDVIEFKASQRVKPANATEHSVLLALRNVLYVPEEELGVNDSLFEFGVTSLNLFALKRQIEKALDILHPIPVGVLMTFPTIRGIANEVINFHQGSMVRYDPVVPLHTSTLSRRPPLWLVHPGSGDVLVFVALAKSLSDRTVYGLRTKGLNTDGDYFASIADIADCYVEKIRQNQPNGPYAIAGYSLGSTVAFEITKRLEALGDRVAFLGILDSPPHIKRLIEKLEWNDVLLNVAYFLELISEEFSVSREADLHHMSSDQALDFIMDCAQGARLEALAIDKERLRKITDVTNAFGQAGKKYEPDGAVQAMDVFWVTPLMTVAGSRQEWMDEHLIQWKEFSVEPPRYHECEGMHSKMLNSEYVAHFQQRLKSAMIARGI